ncbi:MAG: hypothetical protein Q7T11_00225, partial [Deltaproteobacteria bacterium]|nr:hypothetical protein [Deltaproteobacteria bacterium]
MTVDRVDRDREEAAKADRRREHKPDRKETETFQARYQTRLKPKEESEPVRKSGEKKPHEKDQGNVLQKIIALHNQEDKGAEDQKGDTKKQDEKKQRAKEGDSRSSRSEEGHARL